MAFSGKRPSNASHLLANDGHDAEVLGWLELGPQETHEGGLSHLSDLWASLAQLAHFSTPIQLSCVWPYSWHFTHLIGMRRSFLTVTKWSSTRICPVRSRLATSGLAHTTLSVAVVWLGDLLSGRFHHYDCVSWEVVLLFYGAKVVVEARVEGAITGNEAEYYCVCMGADASFGAELT